MALGLGKDADEKAKGAELNGSNGSNGFGGDYEGFKPDLENGGAAPQYRKMSRIDRPITGSIADMKEGRNSIDDTGAGVSIGAQMEAEAGNAIKYRTCSWQKTAFLLFSEYICLAIMSFPWSYSILGLVPGIILTIAVAGFVLYTSLVVWEFCLRHPEVKDVCDVGQMLFWNYRAAWWFTGVMFILNNTFIQGFHCLVGARYMNTMAGYVDADGVTKSGICSVGFAAIMAVVSWVCSLPRTFNALAKLALVSAFFTFISVLLAAIFAGIESHPGGNSPSTYWPKLGPIDVLVVAAKGTSYVNGMNAFMNISYTFIGQITLPSFIAETKEPKDFPKALWAVTIAEIVVFSLVGGVIYGFTGSKYTVAPAFGSIRNETFLKVSFSFMIPTLIFLGVLYASVTARFVFFRLFAGTRHMGNHTVVGWASWAGILAVTWVLAFIVAEVIPFFSDLLSLMSSLFDSFFGWIFWGVAYIRMRHADYGPGWWKTRGIRGYWGAFLNVFIILVGFYFLGAGTYASVDAIVQGYANSAFPGPFSCEWNGLYTYPQVQAAQASAAARL